MDITRTDYPEIECDGDKDDKFFTCARPIGKESDSLKILIDITFMSESKRYTLFKAHFQTHSKNTI